MLDDLSLHLGGYVVQEYAHRLREGLSSDGDIEGGVGLSAGRVMFSDGDVSDIGVLSTVMFSGRGLSGERWCLVVEVCQGSCDI